MSIFKFHKDDFISYFGKKINPIKFIFIFIGTFLATILILGKTYEPSAAFTFFVVIGSCVLPLKFGFTKSLINLQYYVTSFVLTTIYGIIFPISFWEIIAHYVLYFLNGYNIIKFIERDNLGHYH